MCDIVHLILWGLLHVLFKPTLAHSFNNTLMPCFNNRPKTSIPSFNNRPKTSIPIKLQQQTKDLDTKLHQTTQHHYSEVVKSLSALKGLIGFSCHEFTLTEFKKSLWIYYLDLLVDNMNSSSISFLSFLCRPA